MFSPKYNIRCLFGRDTGLLEIYLISLTIPLVRIKLKTKLMETQQGLNYITVQQFMWFLHVKVIYLLKVVTKEYI